MKPSSSFDDLAFVTSSSTGLRNKTQKVRSKNILVLKTYTCEIRGTCGLMVKKINNILTVKKKTVNT